MTVNGIDVIVSRKRIKNIYLRIKPDGSVSVTAPVGCSDEKIYSFVSSKLSWIYRTRKKVLDKFEEENGVPESISIFGVGYPVKYFESEKEAIYINEDDVEVHVPNPQDQEKVQELVEKMYRKLSHEEISLLLPKWEKRMDLYPEEWKICKMKTMWGNCRPKTKTIHFSLNLAGKPREFIEYVIVHELAHLKENNHSKRFWNIVEKYIPDYKRIRKTGKNS